MAMATPSPLSLLAFLTISLLHLSMHARSATHWQDVQVLKQLKRTITPSSIPAASCIDSWDFAADPCDALFTDKFTCGLRCDAVSDSAARVTELALDSAGYSAPLSAVSWSLPYLQNLDFSNNNFSGDIPDSLSQLTRLQRLALSHNSLSGSVPDSLGSLSLLEEMYLDNNMLTGAIPSSLNGLKNLRRLELQDNQLSGEFPDLSQLSNLNFLDASDNALSGQLPEALPPSLIELVMRSNQIQGSIPATAAASLPWLQVMDLSHNRLSESVPASLFTHPSLEQLTLSYNQLGFVQVPGNSGLTSPLISVDLSNNRIRGLLPGFMGLMPRLSALSLENNEFTGPIPAEYVLKVLGPGSGLGQFERLLLGGNYLFGAIPGGFLELKAGSLTVRLGDNCLYRCPLRFFFCEGGVQKSLTQCRAFGPIIP